MSLDIFAAYATDESLENNGTWFPLVGDARVLVARAGNRKHGKVLSKLVEQHRQTLDRKDELADQKSEEIMIEAMAEAILLGWENLTFKGQPMEVSISNAKTLLAIKDFRTKIAELSNDVEAYKFKQEEEQGKA